jgi:hypothetical protein
VTSPQGPRTTQPVEYKGEPLDAARGPGLSCFWIQLVVLVGLVILTPLTVSLGAPPIVSAVLLFVVILLLLLTGQTMIFLLRLVAAGRSEGRRRPLASTTRTIGELEDDATAGTGHSARGPAAPGPADTARDVVPAGDDPAGMRQ